MICILVPLAFGLISFFRTLRLHGTFMFRKFDFLVKVFITDEKITRVIRKVIEFFSIWLSTFFTGTTESHIGKYNISEKKPPIKKITSVLKPTNNCRIF